MFAVRESDKLRDLRVLIVDDNSGDRVLYKHMLAESDPGTDYLFLEAESGQAALDIVRSETLDCVLLDYLLPDLLGLDFLEQLASWQQSTRPPIVMLTGFGDEATAVKALQRGAQGYIPKRDLTGVTLVQAIDRAIRVHKVQQSLEKTRQEMAARNRELEEKYGQIEAFYQKIIDKLHKPVVTLRDHMAEMVADIPGGIVDDSVRKQLLRVLAESERLAVSLKNLRDTPGLVDPGCLLVSTRPESVTEVVNGSVNAFRSIAEAAGVLISVSIQHGLPDVPMDRYRIEQVLGNLLDNAIKFTPPKGRVFLRVDQFPESPEEIAVSVSDTGKGIRPGLLSSLFERKPPANASCPQDSPDIGMGLHICSEIIHAHQGQITAKSLPEAGTCLTFTLPLESRHRPLAKHWERAIQKNKNIQWKAYA